MIVLIVVVVHRHHIVNVQLDIDQTLLPLVQAIWNRLSRHLLTLQFSLVPRSFDLYWLISLSLRSLLKVHVVDAR